MTSDMIKDVLESAYSSASTSMGDATWTEDRDYIFEDLNAFCARLRQLQNSDLSNNNRIRLFCRQLKRLMDNNNDNLEYKFWLSLNDYFLYVLNEPESRQMTNKSHNLFQKRITFEEELEQRQREFQLKMQKQKSLDEFIEEHKEPIEMYIKKSERFHSKLQLTNLIENIDEFLQKNYDLKDLQLTLENRQSLENELKCIEIPLHFLNRRLEDKSDVYSIHAQLEKPVSSNPTDFVTSANSEIAREHFTESIIELLEAERWLVILGDPANGKTTLLRSILHIYVEKFYHHYLGKSDGHKKFKSNRFQHLPVRIPILIRTGEFASWLKENSSRKLIDYIGEHTWFSNEYCDNGSRDVLKELIYHGHALILLDGLDEIPEVKNREKILGMVKEFIHTYVKDPDFISAFDDILFDLLHTTCRVAESQAPKKRGGNQIIITSRIVGYDTNALKGTFIKHYLLSVINEGVVNKFAKYWMSNVQEFVHRALLKVEIDIDKEKLESVTYRRIKAVKSVVKKNEKFLFGFSLLNIICTNIFRSSNQFHAKSEIEIFNDVVESAFRFWTKNEPSISRKLLEEFLISFSTYLHLKSPTGLMDTFNITQLARLTVQKQTVSKISAKDRENIADKLLKVLQSNITLVAERGLEVYGFQHLSYQEYFVAQFFVRRAHSFEQIADRFLLNSINPRFRNSLLIALNWINWKWLSNDFNQFCSALVRSNENYSIPLGAILLVDSWNHIQTPPSDSVIFTALESILDCHINLITNTYLITYLCKLPENIIQTWMSNHLNNDKSLSKFCQCLLRQFKSETKTYTEFDMKFSGKFNMESDTESSMESLVSLELSDVQYRKPSLSVICKQLYSFHNENILTKFVINQTLQRIMLLAEADDAVFPYQWISTPRYEIPVSIIHPLILSVLIVICGGVVFDFKYKPNGVSWSNTHMYRESTIIKPILEYITNKNQSHSMKIKTLIEQYTADIEKASISDISENIVDNFVALICLHQTSDIFFNEKYLRYKGLLLAFQKIKQASFFITRMFYEKYRIHREQIETSFKETIQSIIDKFDLSSHQQNPNYSIYNLALKKLSIQWSLQSFSSPDDGDLESVSKFEQFPDDEWEPTQEDFPNELSLLLTFLPLYLQKLYHHLFINRSDETDSLPFVVLLAQRSLHLEDINVTDPNFDSSLEELKSQCKKHFLENYLFVLLTIHSKKESHQTTSEFILSDGLEKLIRVECQRISEANQLPQGQDKDCRLFAASISLARLFQIQSYSTSYNSTTNNNLSSFPIENMSDPILRLIAWDFISEIQNSFSSDRKQRDDLDSQIIRLLKDVQKVPLLTFTFLIVRFYHQRKDVRMICLISKMIGERFGEAQIYNDKHKDIREAVSITLKQFGHLYYLSKSFDPTQWNSSLLFRYLNQQTSFESLDNTFQSLIYITELAFDAHVFQVYTNDDCYDQMFDLQMLISQKIMTYEAARWITNYLREPWNEDTLDQVIKVAFKCLTVEEKALTMIEEWCMYRYENKLKLLAQYAALQLFIYRSNYPDLIEIINEILSTDDEVHLNSVIEQIFNSEVNDITILSQILERWQRNQYYSSKISIWINCKKTLHLFLELEHKRIIQNQNQTAPLPFKSFLFIIKGCSYDLQVEVKEHLRIFIERANEINNEVKEQYVASIIKWIIECKIWNQSNEDFSEELYNYVFSLFDHQSYDYVKKTILVSLYSLLKNFYWKNKMHVLLTNNAICHMEKIISTHYQYPEDVLAVCLLTYGIYFYKLKEIKEISHVSDGMQEIFAKLFISGSTKVISSRAGLCLIIIEQRNEWSVEIPNWFKEKWSLTDEDEYNMLLQQTLFSGMERNFSLDEIFGKFSDEILHKFVCELNKDIENKCRKNYSSDPSPNYIHIAKNSKKFQNALQKNSINERELKNKLYSCARCAKTAIDYESAVELYSSFGILTEELNEMLEWSADRYTGFISIDLRKIKDVSDREVIENLFEIFQSLLNNGKFKTGLYILKLLIDLSRADFVSLIEIHRHVSKIIQELSHKNNVPDWFRKDSMFDDLLDISNVRRDIFVAKLEDHRYRIRLFSVNDIDFEFEKKIEQLK